MLSVETIVYLHRAGTLSGLLLLLQDKLVDLHLLNEFVEVYAELHFFLRQVSEREICEAVYVGSTIGSFVCVRLLRGSLVVLLLEVSRSGSRRRH